LSARREQETTRREQKQRAASERTVTGEPLSGGWYALTN
jgi:hypothetical protein